MCTANVTDEQNFAKIRWRCRRGMLELDKMLLHFFDEAFMSLSEHKRAIFIQLLEATDQTLYGWLLGTTLPDEAEFQDMVLVIRHLYLQKMTAPLA